MKIQLTTVTMAKGCIKGNGTYSASRERAAVVLSLIESAKLNGHDPWAYLKDVF